MPQIFSNVIKPNPYFKLASYDFNNYLNLYINQGLNNVDFVVLEPVYNNLDLSVIDFDPLAYFTNSLLVKIVEGSVKVIFDCSIEGSYVNFPYFKHFLAGYKSRNLDFSSLYYLTGDLEETTTGYNNIYHINTLDSFFKDTIVSKSTAKKDYIFSCLNRKPRYWRSKLIYLVKTDELLKSKSLCSHPKINSASDFFDHTGFDVEDNITNFFINTGPLQVSELRPLQENMQFSNVISHLPEVYSRVCFDVSLETFQEHHKFVTEKTFKPMINQVPVLIWGAPNINTDGLASIGFKTYEEWFDLSFDSEKDTEKRLYLLLKEIKRVTQILIDMDDEQQLQWQHKNASVIAHNYNQILNLLPKNKIEFNRLFEDLSRA